MEIEDPTAMYDETRAAAVAMFRGTTVAQSEQMVPLTPDWRVVDVAAHVCGIVDDVLHGNVDGLGTDEWTAAQVAKRAGQTIDEVCDEWLGYAPKVDAMIDENPFFGVRITGDLIIHFHDVQHALGADPERDGLATRAAAHRYVPSLQERALEQLDLGIAVALSDGGEYPAPQEAATTLSLRATSYDFLRSVTGRRSRAQVAGLDWDGDPTPLLDTAWNTYGPMRTADVSI